jgi:hypothetical protein
MAGLPETLNPSLFQFTGGKEYSSPLYRYIHTFLPKTLAELFIWCEHIMNNSPAIATSIRRFAEYPVTEIMYPENTGITDLYKDYFYKINLKQILMDVGYDFYTYGNAFVSPFYPFERYLQCQSCKQSINTSQFNDYKIQHKFVIKMKCPSKQCSGKEREADLVDRKVRDPNRLTWIRWSPKDIDIEFNEISGSSRYHLRVPQNIIEGLKNNNLHIFRTTPKEVIEAVRLEKRFLFKDDQIFHLRAHTPAGYYKGWGFPILSSALYELIHIAILKRANEAIAWEHIVPRLVISPAPNGTSGDPLKHISMAKWKVELEKSKNNWNKDPNYIMFAPFPINTQTLGGDGRALMVSQEIEAAEKNLAMSLGVPLEFAAGTLSWQSSAMSLRLLKNQMHIQVSRLERLSQWMVDISSKYLKWPTFKVTFEPFELVDDPSRSSNLINLAQAGIISKDTLLDTMGLDYTEELAKLLDEKIDETKLTRNTQTQLTREVNSLLEKARQAKLLAHVSNPASGTGYTSDQVNQVAQQLANMEANAGKQALAQLQQQDPQLYQAVYSRLQQMAQEQSSGQTAQSPSGVN